MCSGGVVVLAGLANSMVLSSPQLTPSCNTAVHRCCLEFLSLCIAPIWTHLAALQLYGKDLDPFTVDKQNVVLLTLTTVFNALEANPVFYVNISNFMPDGQAEHGRAPNGESLTDHESAPGGAHSGRR